MIWSHSWKEESQGVYHSQRDALKHPVHIRHFPLNPYPPQNLREMEKFSVNFAKTSTHMESTIPYLQRMLNSERWKEMPNKIVILLWMIICIVFFTLFGICFPRFSSLMKCNQIEYKKIARRTTGVKSFYFLLLNIVLPLTLSSL